LPKRKWGVKKRRKTEEQGGVKWGFSHVSTILADGISEGGGKLQIKDEKAEVKEKNM